ncbi:MAG: hypothetical protein ACTHLN_00605, partial [Tepidisphaeraceae bacterium]
MLAIVLSQAIARAAGETGGQVVAGQARFTVITPQCIRMEYNADGHFVDEPSYFAANRTARYTKAAITRDAGQVTIDTGVIHLVYTPDGKPFDATNLHATIRQQDQSIEWRPGTV